MSGGHRLHTSGVLSCFHSILVNDQWRVVFGWSRGQAHDVQIVDYH